MEEKIIYNCASGNVVVLSRDSHDFEVLLNGMQVMSTGDPTEAELVAESLDVAINILDVQNKLK